MRRNQATQGFLVGFYQTPGILPSQKLTDIFKSPITKNGAFHLGILRYFQGRNGWLTAPIAASFFREGCFSPPTLADLPPSSRANLDGSGSPPSTGLFVQVHLGLVVVPSVTVTATSVSWKSFASHDGDGEEQK